MTAHSPQCSIAEPAFDRAGCSDISRLSLPGCGSWRGLLYRPEYLYDVIAGSPGAGHGAVEPFSAHLRLRFVYEPPGLIQSRPQIGGDYRRSPG